MDERLYLGVAKADITPKVGARLYGYRDDVFSKSVHDSLNVTAFVLQNGDTKAILISATVCLIETTLANQIRERIAKDLSVPIANCILCATHTHSGPCTHENAGWGEVDTKYCEEIFVPKIYQAVKDAAENMIAVKVGVSTGESYVGINRREMGEDNRSHLGQNTSGPFDPHMTILSFRSDNDEPVANIIHYGAHGTAAGDDEVITRDWSGIMTDRLEELTGAVTAFFNGAEGDVGPRLSNGKTVGSIRHVEELGEMAAKDAVRIYNQTKEWRHAKLQCTGSVIRIPCEPRKPLEVAQKELEEFGEREGIEPRSKRAYRMLEETIKSYGNGYIEKEYLEIPQSIVRIGEVVFISFPYELFSEIGMRIKKESGIPHALSLSNANGSEGYFITEGEFDRKGYEVEMHINVRIQGYKPNADQYIVRDTLTNLKSVMA